MDLRTNQEVMGMQNRYGSHMFRVKETFDEADIKGNNNLYNSLKTEANSNHSHDPSSLVQVHSPSRKNLEVDNSLFSYSSFKKAMDLRTHNRTLDGGKRTIFDDAEHFAKNHCYKLLPITFEQVDEMIIQSEHNYSLFSLMSESETEEGCSRMMDYSQIKEKNYKRRRTKFREGSDVEEGGTPEDQSIPEQDAFATGSPTVSPEPENSAAVQPLDLSAAPPAEEKTDVFLQEKDEEIVQPDSDKENANAEPNGIRVTITRPDEKENYQPCDLFLNDIARLVPWLIDKDCLEVDILDRTCDRHDEFRKHRLYYVIAESTWRLFQGTNERVILTNDQSLGQPLWKAEKGERPSYLVFDQFSLANCLAEHCQEIGGCFEYTCVEEGEHEKKKETEKVGEIGEIETADEVEVISEATEELKTEEKVVKIDELCKDSEEESPKGGEDKEEETTTEENPEKVPVGKPKEKETELRIKKETRASPAARKTKKEKARTAKKQTNPKAKPPNQSQPKSDRMTTRSKSTSESETSQKSDKPVNRRGSGKRGRATRTGSEPPNKIPKRTPPEPHPRKTRSGKVLHEAARKPAVTEKEGAAGLRKRGKAAEVPTRSLRSKKRTQKKAEERRISTRTSKNRRG